MKTLKIEEKTHTKLNVLKSTYAIKTLSETIDYLLWWFEIKGEENGNKQK